MLKCHDRAEAAQLELELNRCRAECCAAEDENGRLRTAAAGVEEELRSTRANVEGLLSSLSSVGRAVVPLRAIPLCSPDSNLTCIA